MESDNRIATHGQPIAIVGLFASLAVGVLLFLFFSQIWAPILTRARERATQDNVVQANNWLSQLGDNLLIPFVLIAVFGIIVLAVFRSSFVN